MFRCYCNTGCRGKRGRIIVLIPIRAGRFLPGVDHQEACLREIPEWVDDEGILLRWIKTKKKDILYGDKRTIIKFLFFPTRAGDETRWLETAIIEQEMTKVHRCIPESKSVYETGIWMNRKFKN